jgi:hypothetical protein
MKYKIRISKWKIIGLLVVLIFILFLAYHSGNNPDYQFKSEKIMPEKYWSLFKDDLRQKATVIQSLTLKDQNPISELSIDEGKYFVEVFQLDVKSEESLTSLITLSDKKEINSNGIFYYPVGPLFGVFYKTAKSQIFHINLNLKGNPIQTTVKNDSVIAVYSKFDRFLINYNNSDTTAIYANSNRSAETELQNNSLPISLIFYKKNREVFLILMSVSNAQSTLDSQQLYDLINF